MADFDRNTLGNTFPMVNNQTDNPQFTYRTTPMGSKLAGDTEFRVYAKSLSENVVNKASLTYSATGSDDILFQADSAGSNGDNITVEILNATSNGGSTTGVASITVSGTDISIELDDDGAGTITTNVQGVIDAVNNDVDASALVDASLAAGSATSVVTNTLTQTNLDGGVDTEVDTDLDSIEVQLRTENRPSSAEQFLVKLPGPASSDIDPNDANKPNSVNEYITQFLAGTLGSGVSDQTDQNSRGPDYDAAGFNFKFSGSGNEGMWVIEIPGATTDDQYTFTAPSDNTLDVLPGGIVLANVQVKSVDSFGNFYYYGDNTGTNDSIRGWKMYTPYHADLNDDGNMVDIFRVADSVNTTTALDYGINFGKLSRTEVQTAIDTVDTNIQTSVGEDVTGDTAVINVSDALSGGSAGSVDAALTNESRIIADIPTVGRMADRGVRVTVPAVDAAPADAGMEGEIRMDTANNNLYVYSGGAWVSVSLS